MSDTLTRPETRTSHGGTDDGDHERFAHYVYRPKGDPRSAKTIVMDAMFNGTPVRALCGKKWVPTRDPKRYPVCPDCKRIYEEFGLTGSVEA